MINKLLDSYDRGDPIDPADLATYFVNVDKGWVDKIRKDVFKELISDVDRLANVSGHCWRGGLQPCSLSSMVFVAARAQDLFGGAIIEMECSSFP